MSNTQNVHIFKYKTAFKISMSKIPKGVRLVPLKSQLMRAN